MANYRFTEKAQSDLGAIIQYTEQQWGKPQAHHYIDSLQQQCQLLAENPLLGVNRNALSSELFSFPFQSHNLYYLVDGGDITVIRVLHQRMDVVGQLGE